jgi:hypothetical protein
LQVKFSMRASNPNLQIKKIPCNKQIQYTTWERGDLTCSIADKVDISTK